MLNGESLDRGASASRRQRIAAPPSIDGQTGLASRPTPLSAPLHPSAGCRKCIHTGSPLLQSDPVPWQGGPVLPAFRVKATQFPLGLFRIGSHFGG